MKSKAAMNAQKSKAAMKHNNAQFSWELRFAGAVSQGFDQFFEEGLVEN